MTKPFVRYPRTRYKSHSWRKNAWTFLKKKNRQHGGCFLRNALNNFRRRSYKVGWTAKDAKGHAHAFQQRWRKRYWETHGKVI